MKHILLLFAVLSSAFLLSCDSGEEGETGVPIGPPNPNDPHPFWVADYNGFVKYDRSGNRIASFLVEGEQGETTSFCFLNPCNGDLWFSTYVLHGDPYIRIYDRTGKYKSRINGAPVSDTLAIDTNRRWVWFGDYDDVRRVYYLNRISFAGGAATRVDIPHEGPFGSDFALGVYDRTGDIWVLGKSRDDGELIKISSNGALLFSGTLSAMGISKPMLGEGILVDQTDGGVWINCTKMGGGYIQKIDRDGSRGVRINAAGYIYDVGRSSARVLVNNMLNRQLELYDAAGTKLWGKADYKYFYAGGLVDSTGDAVAVYQKNACLRVSMFNGTGMRVFEDIAVFAGGGPMTAVIVQNAPYPY